MVPIIVDETIKGPRTRFSVPLVEFVPGGLTVDIKGVEVVRVRIGVFVATLILLLVVLT